MSSYPLDSSNTDGSIIIIKKTKSKIRQKVTENP